MKKKKTFEKIRELILDWAFKRGLINRDFSKKQYGKVAEEIGEFEEAWLAYEKDPTPATRVAMMIEFGDVLVTLIILAAQLRIDPIECLELAYTKIKDRKGKTIDGTFVKEEDLEVEDE